MGTVVEQKGEQEKEREVDRGSARRDHQGVMSFGLELVLRNSYSPQNSVLSGQLRAGLVSGKVSWLRIEWPQASPAIAQTQGMHVPSIDSLPVRRPRDVGGEYGSCGSVGVWAHSRVWAALLYSENTDRV